MCPRGGSTSPNVELALPRTWAPAELTNLQA